MDVNDINTITYNASKFSGEYQKQNLNIESYEEKIREESISGSSKKRSKMFLKMISSLKNLNKKGIISGGVLSAFTSKIFDTESGYKTYKMDLSTIDTGIDLYNPFKKDGKNFSVYQVDFINNSSENVTYDISNFVISSGFEQLNPYKDEFYTKLYTGNIDKLQLARRLNMPNSLTLPADSKVRRYLTTSPLNLDTKSLSVKIIENISSTSFEFQVESSVSQDIVSFYNFIVSSEDNYKYNYNKYFAILEDEAGKLMIVRTDKISISEADSNKIFKLYIIGFSSDRFSIGLRDSFKFKDVSTREVRAKFIPKKDYKN